PNRNIYRYNYVHDTGYLQNGFNTAICQPQTAFAIGIANVTATDNQIYNNLIVHNVGALATSGNNTLIYNNTVYNNSTGTVPFWCCYAPIEGGTGTGNVIKNNISFSNAFDAPNYGTATQSNNFVADPTFVNPGVGAKTIPSGRGRLGWRWA